MTGATAPSWALHEIAGPVPLVLFVVGILGIAVGIIVVLPLWLGFQSEQPAERAIQQAVIDQIPPDMRSIEAIIKNVETKAYAARQRPLRADDRGRDDTPRTGLCRYEERTLRQGSVSERRTMRMTIAVDHIDSAARARRSRQ